MKKIISGFCLLLIGITGYAQNGLENIIVEKYYITDAKDAKAEKKGKLPVGSVTYRIFVDMLPGYRFQAAYGVPGHELKLSSTTLFYNNENGGATVANDIADNQLKNNTVMLDSWLSVGAAGAGYSGILKDDDDTEATVINSNDPKILQNTDPGAGIPIKNRDGLFKSSPQAVVAQFGIEKEITVFGNQDPEIKRSVFSTTNGSWASFGGAIGPTPDNRVLIVQVTTNGEFSFELNIQLGTPKGGVENYVARNPVEKEIQLSTLIFPPETQSTNKNN